MIIVMSASLATVEYFDNASKHVKALKISVCTTQCEVRRGI